MKIAKLSEPSDSVFKIILAATLIVLAVTCRLFPHPPNFAPIAAIAIFGGTVLPRKWALSLPLICMVASDLIIGLHSLIFYTWGCFVLIAFLSNRYLKRLNPVTIAGTSIGASALFFLVTNFGVWIQGWLYPLTYSGLVECYVKALPFFRNTIAGDLLFTSILFAAYVLILKACHPDRTLSPSSSNR
jgi:hypothetical protein